MSRLGQTVVRLALYAYVALLAAVSLLPSGPADPLGGWDKSLTPTVQNVAHVPAYAALELLAVAAAVTYRRPGLAGALALALACSVFGGLMEWAQTLVPGRTGSVSDVLWNVVGAAVGCLAAVAWLRGRRGGQSTPADEPVENNDPG